MKRLFLSILCLVCTVCASGAGRFLVTDFGARGDGMTIDSRAINSAIEAAASSGGGAVIFPTKAVTIPNQQPTAYSLPGDCRSSTPRTSH